MKKNSVPSKTCPDSEFSGLTEPGLTRFHCIYIYSFNLVVPNTFFTKETQMLVTYESGGVSSVVDYVLARKT